MFHYVFSVIMHESCLYFKPLHAQADCPLPVSHPPPHHIQESPGALKGTHKELTVGGQINPPQLNNRGALNFGEVDDTQSVFVMEMS